MHSRFGARLNLKRSNDWEPDLLVISTDSSNDWKMQADRRGEIF
jgi:hypothetical protein